MSRREDILDGSKAERSVACMNGIFSYLKPVSQSDALRRRDYYGKIGSWKIETFKPLLFPDPLQVSPAKPYFGQLPIVMRSVTPYNRWTSEDVGIIDPDRGFIHFGKGVSKL